MKNRYVFPILNSKKDIVGFSGRDLNSQSKIKWKHLGEKINWCYPLFLNIDNLQYTGLVFQAREKDYPPNTYFQYHCFRGTVTSGEIQNALGEFEWLNEHPKAFARMKKDVREKDALAWFDPRRTKMMGKWSPSIVVMYLNNTL